MILFKAINYDGESPKEMRSVFKGNYTLESCWEDMITTAFSHISSGDRKKEGNKDYWISTTKDYKRAIEYMNNTKHNFNGIAVINLPNTDKTGYIYDDTLREYGYVEKEIGEGKTKCNWKTNDDGIATTLDMSCLFTINYLASYLWLKGNQDSLGNVRTIKYGNSSDEVLLLGEKIKFKFIPKNQVNELLNKLKNNEMNNEIPNYYMELFEIFIKYAPESKYKDDLLKLFSKTYYSYNDEYNDYFNDEVFELRNNGIPEDYVDENEIKRNFAQMKENQRDNELGYFYKNAGYEFNRKQSYNRFHNLPQLSYADSYRLSEYDIIEKYADISFEEYLYAYIYSACYIKLKLNGALEKYSCLWEIINKLYDYRFISWNIQKEDFFRYYTNVLGLCPNIARSK